MGRNARQALLATLTIGSGQGFPDDYSLRGYIDASMVSSTSPGSARGLIQIFVNGSASGSGAALFDAINAISSSDTRITEINLAGQAGGGFICNLTIWIDWIALKVQWQGAIFQGLMTSTYQGAQDIEALGGLIQLSSSQVTSNIPHGNFARSSIGPTLSLETGPGRKIIKLPCFTAGAASYGISATPINSNCYTITTDTGVVVTAAPTPPAETPTVAPVVGVKISELNVVDALQDDDLFVLSQDNASDGTYDTSYNVTLAGLKTNIAGGTSSVVMLAPSTSENASSAGVTLNLTDYSIPAGAKQLIVGCWVGSAQGTSTIGIAASSADYSAGSYYVAGTSMADGDGDYVRNFNQGIYPINQADNTIYIKASSTASMHHLAKFQVFGYIT